MELLEDYIKGLNLLIASGGDVTFFYRFGWYTAIREITILKEEKKLHVWYLKNGRDLECQISVKTQFHSEMNDLPNELREAGWE
jgi:hypothetical protein